MAARNLITADFEAARGKNDVTALKAAREALIPIEKGIDALNTFIDEELFDHDMQNIRTLFSELDDPESPNVGLAFIERLDETGCKIVIGENLTADKNSLRAVYTSYSYGKEVRGFINEIAVNKFKLANVVALMDSVEHEVFHALQKYAAPALHLSPFNPDTLVIVHPLDWIQLEGLCERDAYAKEGFFNYLISKTNPLMRERAEYDVVSVEDFEKAQKKYPPLHKALIHIALNALYKPTVEGDDSKLFSHHYQGVALGNYIAGMAKRAKDGQTGHVFVRLEPEDFYAVGDYKVGPNSLGRGALDPGFLYRPTLKKVDQDRYDALCSKYDIPPLDECPTMVEHTNTLIPQTQSAQERTGYAMADAAAYKPAF